VEQRAVDDRRESVVVTGEGRDVGADERRVVQAALFGGFGGRGNRRGGDVDTDDGVAPRSERQRQFRVAASGVEDFTADPSVLDQRRELGLRLADVPRRWAGKAPSCL
jgi:hypothetical protein